MNRKIMLSLIVLAGAVLLSGCAEMDNGDLIPDDRTVESGDIVSFHYTAMHEDGTVFETSREEVAQEHDIHVPDMPYEPLTVQVGTQQIIPGLEEALMGMSEGEQKSVTLEPEDAYGEYQEDFVIPVSIEEYQQLLQQAAMTDEEAEIPDPEDAPQEGDVIEQMGQRLTVVDVTDTHVELELQILFSIEEYQEFMGTDEVPEVGEDVFTPMGQQLTVKDVTDTHIEFDPNHPMAGKTLTFDIEVVSIEDEPEMDETQQMDPEMDPEMVFE
ncbi:FKBP-type peptidyl-prolyl cis-trans isomerase [Methanosalsum natronophilum]|uniref:FKBP-type peptidyl-prolyl cis-trans isomerase n=1 Tax=Methanosalsum natronophilum TaxID=768733 RepID=UPI0021679938|nr:FKBP-type peptidyl-prolyl cis-trans isomerase [Methanosalsum natronophilum]MCS3924205.1 FKBP-type peptidyl-prolyl cis-trans isomerase 2 [Methanosalsum natronophilum]